MTFATYVMTFDQEKWVMRNLENAYPHVDQIYVMHSKRPWNYKPENRDIYTNRFDISLIENCKYRDKITLIEGEWDSDTGQRNNCLEIAKADGIDYLMIHDADEFYFHNDFEKLVNFVKNDNEHAVFSFNLYAFWKSFKYIIINHDQSRIAGNNQTIINLHKVDKYDHIRDVYTDNKITIPDVIQYHGSYVLSDEQIYRKVNTTSHSNEYDGKKWYNEVWLPWTLQTKNLHPIWPWAWSHCEIFDGELPEAIKDFDVANNLDKI